MSGLLFPAVRVNFSLATLVRHAHQRDQIASNSHSVSSLSIIHNYTEALRSTTPQEEKTEARECQIRSLKPRMTDRKCALFHFFPPAPVSFCLAPNFTGRNWKCAHSQTRRLRARAHAPRAQYSYLFTSSFKHSTEHTPAPRTVTRTGANAKLTLEHRSRRKARQT